MRRGVFLLILLTAGLGILAGGFRVPGVSAGELLMNGGFETWDGGSPARWSVEGAAAQSMNAVAGSALQLQGSGGARVYQLAAVSAGATYHASVSVAGDAGSRATLGVEFFDRDFLPVPAGVVPLETPLGPAYKAVSLAFVAPPNAESAWFMVRFKADGAGAFTAFADEASLVETSPPPPPTPTPTLAPPTPGQTVEPPATASATGAADSTTTPRPAKTTRPPTPPPTAKASAPARTTPGTRGGALTPADAAPRPTARATASPTRGSGQAPPDGDAGGGLLANGGFELEEDGKPAYWSKYGGALGLATGPGAYRGNRAATLTSDTSSTKWIYQAVEVAGSEWYAAAAYARVASGQGEVFLRLSWYATDDASGTMLEQADSDPSTLGQWAPLEVNGRAPEGARSVRVRLMLRPLGPVTAAFDEVSLFEAPPPEPAPATETPVTAEPLNQASAVETGLPVPATPPMRIDTRPDALPDRPAQTGPATLRLSEVLSDPPESGRDGVYEWVELVNIGPDPVDLAGWGLGDAKEVDVLPAFAVPPGGYVVVAAKSAALPEGIAVARVKDGQIGDGLNNTGDVVRLVAPGGTEVDALSYGDDPSVFDQPPPAPGPGRTLGVRVPGAEPSAENWGLTDQPSPGAANTFAAVGGGRVPQAEQAATKDEVGPTGEMPVDDENGPSAIPWIALGVASGLGLAGAGVAGQRLWPRVGGRMRRDG